MSEILKCACHCGCRGVTYDGDGSRCCTACSFGLHDKTAQRPVVDLIHGRPLCSCTTCQCIDDVAQLGAACPNCQAGQHMPIQVAV